MTVDFPVRSSQSATVIRAPPADGSVCFVKAAVRPDMHRCGDRSTGHSRAHDLAVTRKRRPAIQLYAHFQVDLAVEVQSYVALGTLNRSRPKHVPDEAAGLRYDMRQFAQLRSSSNHSGRNRRDLLDPDGIGHLSTPKRTSQHPQRATGSGHGSARCAANGPGAEEVIVRAASRQRALARAGRVQKPQPTHCGPPDPVVSAGARRQRDRRGNTAATAAGAPCRSDREGIGSSDAS